MSGFFGCFDDCRGGDNGGGGGGGGACFRNGGQGEDGSRVGVMVDVDGG